MRSAARALQAHRLLMRLGFGMVSVFIWIFLFEFFTLASASPARAMLSVAIVYAFAQFIALLLTPIAAGHLRRGVRPAMIAGILLLASAFVVLGAILSGAFGETPLLWGVLFFAFLFGAYRALYWIPYRVHESLRDEPLNVALEVLIALIPAVTGAAIVAVSYGPERVLFGAAAFLALSILPIFALPDIHESYSWHYSETYARLFRPQYRGILLHGFFDGIQGAALFLIWPLAVFLIVGTSYLTLGIVMSATLLVLLILRRPLQRLFVKWKLHDSDVLRVTLAVSGWVFRLAVATPIGIVFADSYSYLGAPKGKSIELFSFEQSADSSAYIDEYSALKEISLALGRIALCICFALLVYFLSLPLAIAGALAIAAISAGCAVIFSRRKFLSL